MKKIFLVLTLVFFLTPITAYGQLPINPNDFTSIAQKAAGDRQCGEVKWLEQATGITDGLIIPCGCLDRSGDTACGLNEALQTLVNVSKVILAITGAAAMLMFAYGGVMFIIAAGAQDKVQQGKDAIKAATIGIVIVLTAWLIVNFTISAITKGEVTGGDIFDRPWTSGPSATNGEQPTPSTGEPSENSCEDGQVVSSSLCPILCNNDVASAQPLGGDLVCCICND